jgi:uncharacterized protein
MKLHLAHHEGLQLFSGYGAGYVAVNNVRYERSVVVSPQVVTEWAVERFEALTLADFGFIDESKPEIVILGTGSAQRFPPPRLAHALTATGVGARARADRDRRWRRGNGQQSRLPHLQHPGGGRPQGHGGNPH